MDMLEELMEAAVKMCTATLAKDGSIAPHVVAKGCAEDPEAVHYIPLRFDDEQWKQRSAWLLKLWVAWKMPAAYVFVSEAWMKSIAPDQLEAYKVAGKEVREYEDRSEIAMINGVTPTHARSAHASIVREEGGKVYLGEVTWGSLEPKEGEHAPEGRLADFYPPAESGPMPEAIRTMCEMMFDNTKINPETVH